MAPLTFRAQDRAIQLAARLGDEEVTVTRIQATEELSRLYCFHLDFLSSNHHLAARDLIYQNALIGIQCKTARNSDAPSCRYLSGVVNRFSYRGEVAMPGQSGDTLSRYHAEIVPWLWFLTRTTNCRIFQSQTAVEIIETILGEHRGSFTTSGIRETYPSREYCVQYRESDFAFVSRLLEEEGIFYFFRHSEHGHELVLADRIAAYYTCADDQVRLNDAGTAATVNHIVTWEHEYEFHSGSFTHTDFNYRSTTTDLTAREASIRATPGSNRHARFDYPGEYDSVTEGRRLARIRMQEEEAAQEVVRGDSVCPSFAPGGTFQLADHPNQAEAGQNYVITAVQHLATYPLDRQELADETSFTNRFTCIPATTIFRPSRLTPRPILQGAQTATVTGPEGENVYPDELGRVKVQFHWDRIGQRNESSSCWIRVSQDWAGSGYGSVYLPHIGHEVIVSFLEGDPDRPVITGRLYNATNMPPEELPKNKHRAIVAQDEVGNVIALDADEKRVDIQNAEDKFELTAGEEVSATAGMNVGITLGCEVGINLGASASASLAASFDVGVGFSSSVFIGGAYDASFGGTFSYAKGNFVNAGDSVGQIAFKQAAEFVSHESVMLAGGSGAENSVLLASSDGLTLSFGTTSPTFAGSPGLALGLGVFGAAVLGTIGIAAAGAAAFLGAKANETNEFNDYAKGAIGAGVGSLACSAAAGVLLGKFAAKWSQVKQPVHGGALPPLGQLQLSSNGAKLWAKSLAQLQGDQSATVVTPSFTVTSPKSTMSGDLDVQGVFTSANIMDIGKPAAAAAAKAKAAAEAARNKALMAAKHAKQSARQAAISAKQAASYAATL